MTPLMRNKLVEYFSYYALSLAQEKLTDDNPDNKKFIKWCFVTLFKIKSVIEWLKLKVFKEQTK